MQSAVMLAPLQCKRIHWSFLKVEGQLRTEQEKLQESLEKQESTEWDQQFTCKQRWFRNKHQNFTSSASDECRAGCLGSTMVSIPALVWSSLRFTSKSLRCHQAPPQFSMKSLDSLSASLSLNPSLRRRSARQSRRSSRSPTPP